MAGRVLISGGTAILPGGPRRADILCEGGRIVAIGDRLIAPDAETVDATGLFVGPGFIDVHVHGGGGFNFFAPDPEAVRGYARWAPRNGVTAFLVSTAARDASALAAVLEAFRPALGRQEQGAAEVLGFHLEGPFVNPVRKGAFDPSWLREPSEVEWERWHEAAGGAIRQVTLAPELPGALPLIARIARSGAVPAIGHTDATAAEVRAGIDAGARHVTHLFNAMRPLHQREGGPIAAVLTDPRVSAELICDGAHVAPEVVRMAYGLLGPARTVVVTDNLQLAGTPASSGSFGRREVTVSGAAAVRDDGTLVGSVATMDQHFRNVLAFLGVDITTAFRLCSENPARVAGVADRKGRLEPGMDADIVLLDRSYHVLAASY